MTHSLPPLEMPVESSSQSKNRPEFNLENLEAIEDLTVEELRIMIQEITDNAKESDNAKGRDNTKGRDDVKGRDNTKRRDNEKDDAKGRDNVDINKQNQETKLEETKPEETKPEEINQDINLLNQLKKLIKQGNLKLQMKIEENEAKIKNEKEICQILLKRVWKNLGEEIKAESWKEFEEISQAILGVNMEGRGR